MDRGGVVKRALLFVLSCACGGEHDVSSVRYPATACSELHVAARDPASYVEEDERASLFADERDVWRSNKCDALRSALPPLDDKHDLEESTSKSECDVASSRVDESVRLACRAGCFAARRHDALVAAWGRAIHGVSALDAKRYEALQKSCHANNRALWECAHLPLPPKIFDIRTQDRVEYVHDGSTTSTRRIGLEWVSVSLRSGARTRSLMFTECAGSGRRWDVFYFEQ